MGDKAVRAIIAAALMLTWLLPMTRLAVLPSQRAQELAADTICRARWEPLPQRSGTLGVTNVVLPSALAADPQLVDIAQLFEPAMAREWRLELAQVGFVALTIASLLAGWRMAPWLAFAAAILYLQQQVLNWDGYRLLWITESPRLWWVAIRQWSAALWSERLIAPMAVWIAMLGSCWMLLQAAWSLWGASAAWSCRMRVRRPMA